MAILQKLIFEEHGLAELMTDLPIILLILVFAVSLYCLVKGSDWLIDAVVNIALRTGIPKAVLGATIVSLGTTLPEVLVSVSAAAMGNSELALGNGIGSIIADTALIFGGVVLFGKVVINKGIMRTLGRWQIGSLVLLSLLIFIASWLHSGENAYLGRTAGIILLLALVIYLGYNLKSSSKKKDVADSVEEASRSLLLDIAILLAGVVFIFIGARFFIASVTEIALRLGISEATIAVTLVAFGTSLPELITAITAVRKNHSDIMMGNVLGADILNALFVVGASATLTPLYITREVLTIHLPVALLSFVLLYGGYYLNRQKKHFPHWQGGLLVALYLGFLGISYF